jgi:hypothetical protein
MEASARGPAGGGGVRYRLVIQPDPPSGRHVPIGRFWFEHARDTFPWWLPLRCEAWWTRWRRMSSKQRMELRSGAKVLVIPLADESEVYQMQADLERAAG